MKKITMKNLILTLALVCAVVAGGKLLADSKKVATIDPPVIRIVADGYVVPNGSIDPPVI